MLSTRKFWPESTKFYSKQLNFFSSTTPEQERLQTFRTLETDPSKHIKDQVGQFYTISHEVRNNLFRHGGLTKSFDIYTKPFNETCIMIRKPAVDIINCINNIDLSKPAVRFVLYGKKGTGKSLTLMHVLHYAFKKGFLIAHIPWVGTWMRYPKEHSNSELREGFIDQNLEISHWLLHFKTQNEHILPVLRTTEEHVWNKRENTPKNSPLIDLLDHGINRIKYASEVAIALSNEIKNLSRDGQCKTLVCIDGFNAFFYPQTQILAPGKIPIPPNRLTATEAFLNLTKFDWNNAVIVLTVDETAVAKDDSLSYLPR